MPHFEAGEVVLHRIPFIDDAGRGEPAITDVKPMVVVEDTAESVALWLPAGTPTILCKPLRAGQPRPWLHGEWELVDARWERWHALFLMEPGAWHATWVLWTPEWEFAGWYVNLQEPFVRTPLGFDARDLWLDLVVDPNRTWRWKDEDEAERVVAEGVVSASTMEHARQEGHRVAATIEAARHPFNDEWRDWRPSEDWPRPTMPEGDVLRLNFK